MSRQHSNPGSNSGSNSGPRELSSSPATRLLIIRFSSFGDIVQVSPVPAAFRARYPHAQIDWLTRADFASLLSNHPYLNEVIAFDRRQGLWGLIKTAWELGDKGYTHLYDAHSNLRSLIFSCVFRLQAPKVYFLRRSKERWRRWLFFRLKIRSALPVPYRGSDSYLRPLEKWGLSSTQPLGPQFWSNTSLAQDLLKELKQRPRPWIVAAPSAAWEMKRWPTEYWCDLVRRLEATVILLGGPNDGFISEIATAAPERTLNLAGRLSLSESSAIVGCADLVISGDTGLLHVADLMEKPTLALIGPTAFGYPSRSNSRVLEVPNSELSCKPCSKDGRGKCQNDTYKKCLLMIQPEKVTEEAVRILRQTPPRDSNV